MPKHSKSPHDEVHIPDLARARAYYASVFDAEFSAGMCTIHFLFDYRLVESRFII